MNKVILRIGGMSCSACSSGLEKYLNKQPGIIHASVNLVLGEALIEYEDTLTLEDLHTFVKEAGYESLGTTDDKTRETSHQREKNLLFLFSILAIFILYLSMSHMIGLPNPPQLDMNIYPKNYALTLLFLTIPFLIYGRDIFKSGWKNLIHKTPNMDTLVSIGVFSSFIYSLYTTITLLLGNEMAVHHLYFESAAIVLFFIKLGRFIDSKSKEKTKEAIKSLVQITPSKALLKTLNGEKEVTIDEVKKKDILIAKPGMKIAVDGVIVQGETHVDEAFITGESFPVKKGLHDRVVAGSINHDGYILYEAKKIGKDSTISEIVHLVMEAANTKAPISHLADKVSGYFVPTIMMISVVTLLGYLFLGYPVSEALLHFVTVLVVACPCALGLATPLAMVVSVGLCASHGILVKSSEILENAEKIDTIVFDKTGTLTYGNLKISKIYNHSAYSEEELLTTIASIEHQSSHPISKAFTENVDKKSLKKVTHFKDLPGIGLQGRIEQKTFYIGNQKLFSLLKIENPLEQEELTLSNLGNSIVYVIEEKQVLAIIGVKDVVRTTTKQTVAHLQSLGKNIIMLTGDNKQTAKMIADSIGIKEVCAGKTPKEKTKMIQELKKQGKKVMMVGDGINDAPSLATAFIGVSINGGTDIAADSADVILMNDDLEKIPELIKISKKTIRNIKQNLFWAFFYNICMIPIAIGVLRPWGISMNPMVGGFAMTASSLTVILNALRLKKQM